ncbi:protein kinase [Novymonas esmeraldas]|uniref:non-specific serine/threonine protein kinase n=1 Tax=Novymonas esmeraldas TaxID=1808958 RepID=A0AAW0ENR4_9TRYP
MLQSSSSSFGPGPPVASSQSIPSVHSTVAQPAEDSAPTTCSSQLIWPPMSRTREVDDDGASSPATTEDAPAAGPQPHANTDGAVATPLPTPLVADAVRAPAGEDDDDDEADGRLRPATASAATTPAHVAAVAYQSRQRPPVWDVERSAAPPLLPGTPSRQGSSLPPPLPPPPPPPPPLLPWSTPPLSVSHQIGKTIHITSCGDATVDHTGASVPTPSHPHSSALPGRKSSFSGSLSRVTSDTRMRASLSTSWSATAAAAAAVVRHVDVPPPTSTPKHRSASLMSSTEATPLASGMRLTHSLDEVSVTGELHPPATGSSSASCVVAHASSNSFRAPPRPCILFGNGSSCFANAPSFNSSVPSASMSILRDRYGSGCGVLSASASLRPFRAISFDRDDGTTDDRGSDVYGAAIGSVSFEGLPHGGDTPVTAGTASLAAVGGGGTAATAASAATPTGALAPSPLRHIGVGGGAAEQLQALSGSFGWRMFASVLGQRNGVTAGGGAVAAVTSTSTTTTTTTTASAAPAEAAAAGAEVAVAPPPHPPPTPPFGIFQSGLLLSLDDVDDAPPSSAMDAPMTPQSFSTLLQARESGDLAVMAASAAVAASATGAGGLPPPPPPPQQQQQTSLRGGSFASAVFRGDSASAATTTVTAHEIHSSLLQLDGSDDALLRQSSQQLTAHSCGGEDVWGGGGGGGGEAGAAAAKGMDGWCVDGGSRDSHGTATTGTTTGSGLATHVSAMCGGTVDGSGGGGGSGFCAGGRLRTPLSSFQLFAGSSQQELPVSGVDVEVIPHTPRDLHSLPPPPMKTLLAERCRQRRRRRQRYLDHTRRHGSSDDDDDGDADGPAETAVIETDKLERARATSSDGARVYEIVNETYVMYDYELGKGSYSTVRLCYNLKDGRFYAVKVLDRVRLKRRQLGSEASLSTIDQEITMMKQVQHKNIIALHEVIRDPNMRYIYLVLELAESREVLAMKDNGDVMPRGNACSLSSGGGGGGGGNSGGNDDDDVVAGRPATDYSEAATRGIVKGLLHALMYAHYLGVAHRDVKPSNVLLTADGTVKLCDFGVSVLVSAAPMQLSRAGSVAFLAPELLLSSDVDVSRFVTPADSSLGTVATRERSVLLTHADDTAANAYSTLSSRAAARPAAAGAAPPPLSHIYGALLHGEDESPAGSRLRSPSAAAASPSIPRAATSSALRRDVGASGFPPRPSSALLQPRHVGGAPRLPPRAASFTSWETASPLISAAAVGDATGVGGGRGSVTSAVTDASLPRTPTVQPLCLPPSEAAVQAVQTVQTVQVDLFKADVFALGVTVFTMLLGLLPWRASNAASQRMAILAEPDPFLRLYKAAYGDAGYTWPARVHAACAGGGAVDHDASSSSCSSSSSSSSSSVSHSQAEVGEAREALYAAPPVPALQTTRLIGHTSAGRAEGAQQQQQQPKKAAPRRLSRAGPSPSFPAVTPATAELREPVRATLAATAPVRGAHTARRTDGVGVTASLAPPLVTPPPPPLLRSQAHLFLPQWRSYGDVPATSTPSGDATAAADAAGGTVETSRTQTGTSSALGVGTPGRRGDASAVDAWPPPPSSSALPPSFETVSPPPRRVGMLVAVPPSLSISGDPDALWDAWGDAISEASGPPPPVVRLRRPTTTPNGAQLHPSIADRDEALLGTDETDGATAVSAKGAQSWLRQSSSDLARTVPSTATATARHQGDGSDTTTVDGGGFEGDDDDDDERVYGSDGAEGSEVSARSDAASTSPRRAASSWSAGSSSRGTDEEDEDVDDEESSSSCESIYERLFELAQPCRPYTVAEHTPLPAVPGLSREISAVAVDFVRACLTVDPVERRTVFELARHPWMQGEPAPSASPAAAELHASTSPPRRHLPSKSEADEASEARGVRGAGRGSSGRVSESESEMEAGVGAEAAAAAKAAESAEAADAQEAVTTSLGGSQGVRHTASTASFGSGTVLLSADSERRTTHELLSPASTAVATSTGASLHATITSPIGNTTTHEVDAAWLSVYTAGVVTPPAVLLRHAAGSTLAPSPDASAGAVACAHATVSPRTCPGESLMVPVQEQQQQQQQLTDMGVDDETRHGAGHQDIRIGSSVSSRRQMLTSPRQECGSVFLSPSPETSATTTPRTAVTPSVTTRHSESLLLGSLPVDERADRLLLSVNTVSTSSLSAHLEAAAASGRAADSRGGVWGQLGSGGGSVAAAAAAPATAPPQWDAGAAPVPNAHEPTLALPSAGSSHLEEARLLSPGGATVAGHLPLVATPQGTSDDGGQLLSSPLRRFLERLAQRDLPT